MVHVFYCHESLSDLSNTLTITSVCYTSHKALQMHIGCLASSSSLIQLAVRMN